MPDEAKTRVALFDPNKDYSHRFIDIVNFLEATGRKLRIKGSHRIFTRTGIPRLLNLQPESSGKAKAYQIRQVRQVLEQFGL